MFCDLGAVLLVQGDAKRQAHTFSEGRTTDFGPTSDLRELCKLVIAHLVTEVLLMQGSNKRHSVQTSWDRPTDLFDWEYANSSSSHLQSRSGPIWQRPRIRHTCPCPWRWANRFKSQRWNLKQPCDSVEPAQLCSRAVLLLFRDQPSDSRSTPWDLAEVALNMHLEISHANSKPGNRPLSQCNLREQSTWSRPVFSRFRQNPFFPKLWKLSHQPQTSLQIQATWSGHNPAHLLWNPVKH